MNHSSPHHIRIKFWGDYALFTDPICKVERVSYPCMTPSAAKGCLEAIFWKPEMKWIIHSISICKPIQYFHMKRNEVNCVIPTGNKNYDSFDRFYADQTNKVRQQRTSMFLKQVCYVVEASMVTLPHATESAHVYAYRFHERMKTGACFERPYLGCRESTAYFDYATHHDIPIHVSKDLGTMFYGWNFEKQQKQKKPVATPLFFLSEIKDGVLYVPSEEEVGKNYAHPSIN